MLYVRDGECIMKDEGFGEDPFHSPTSLGCSVHVASGFFFASVDKQSLAVAGVHEVLARIG